MATNVKVKLNRRGMRALLTSSEVRGELEDRAQRIAASAGPGHRVDSETGRNRARAAVITDTTEARIAEATDRTLTRAIDAGR